MPTTKPAARKTIASVQRALDILNLFNNKQTELGNAEIAKRVNLAVGTASGLIYTLKINNYLDQNPTNRKYRLGLKLAERAAVLLDALDLRKIAGPYLEELRDWCGESVNMAMRDSNEVVYIERLYGTHSLGIRSELGKRGPLHSTALGKAILAFIPTSEFDTLMNGYDFFPVTPYTITDLKSFSEEILKIHAKGFAVDGQENELGGRCVAAPIFDRVGYPIAAVSVSVPIQRLPEKDVDKFGDKLKWTGLTISKQLGFVNEAIKPVKSMVP
jgi:IclR family transcriptional regulator, KDG regulon repressor